MPSNERIDQLQKISVQECAGRYATDRAGSRLLKHVEVCAGRYATDRKVTARVAVLAHGLAWWRDGEVRARVPAGIDSAPATRHGPS